MADSLQLSPRHRSILERLLQEHLPNVEAWAYGSRVNSHSHDGSDLDLALRAPGLTKISTEQLADFKDAVCDSEIPFLVDARDWARLPEKLQREIERSQVILTERQSKPDTPRAAAQSVSTGAQPDHATDALKDMCDLIADCPHFTPDWTDSGYVVIRNQNIRNGKLDLSNPSFTHEADFHRRIQRARPRAGDIIFTREAPMGEVCMVPSGLECCLGQRQVLIRPPSESSGNYLLYALQSPAVRRQIFWNEGTGSTVSNVRIPVLKALRIPRLKSGETAAGDFLAALDDKIELNRRMNETLESMARALFKSWFVDFEPVRAKMEGQDCELPTAIADLFPAKIEDCRMGPIPTDWQSKPLGDCFNLTMGQSPPSTSYNETGNGLPFFQGRKDFGFRYPVNRRFCTAPSRIARPGDTLVSVRAPVGDINMASTESCVRRGVAAIRHRSDSPSYTFYAISAIRHRIAEFEHTGSVFGAITGKQFATLTVIEPSSHLVRAFENLAGPFDLRIKLNVAESQTLTHIRDTLLPKLVSGEIHVLEAEDAVAAVL